MVMEIKHSPPRHMNIVDKFVMVAMKTDTCTPNKTGRRRRKKRREQDSETDR